MVMLLHWVKNAQSGDTQTHAWRTEVHNVATLGTHMESSPIYPNGHNNIKARRCINRPIDLEERAQTKTPWEPQKIPWRQKIG